MITIDLNNKVKISDIDSIVFKGQKIDISANSIRQTEESYSFLCDFVKDKVIYGVNTGFGPMAQYKIEKNEQIGLQYNLIRSHAAGAGKKLDNEYVKSAMFVRLCSILKGFSGIHPSTISLLKDLINNDVYPYIPENGGVGASGDLVQLSHLALVLIGEGQVCYNGKLRETASVFNELSLRPIEVKIREGLSLINGTSVMTGIAAINLIKAQKLLNCMIPASAMINEIVRSFDDYFSKELNSVKAHSGQNFIADSLVDILKTGKRILRRDDFFYNGSEHCKESIINRKVQEHYSLRCVPQILGPVYDTIINAREVVENELNSVSDNPIIDHKKGSVFHGGNFHGDYVSFEMDKLKAAITKLSILSERHLAFLCNPKINNILPPFINLGKLGYNLGMQGVQFTATSTVAENQMLSNPMYVHSIPTNNDNQDIVSMGTNSALIAGKVIDNAFIVLAIEMIALIQAVDYLQIAEELSEKTKEIYYELRKIVPVFSEDTPKYEEIKKVCDYLYEAKTEL